MINKVDLPSAQTEDVKQQIIELVGCERAKLLRQVQKVGLVSIKFLMLSFIEFLPLWIKMKIKLEH